VRLIAGGQSPTGYCSTFDQLESGLKLARASV
jgi:hypothetical protein